MIVSVNVPSPLPMALVARTPIVWTAVGVSPVHVTRPDELIDTPVGRLPVRLHDVGESLADIWTVPPVPNVADAVLFVTVGATKSTP